MSISGVICLDIRMSICKICGLIWAWVRWPLLILIIGFCALVIYRVPAVQEKERAAAVVQHVRAQAITMDDVLGTYLPPMTDKELNNATIAGPDTNTNGIRDDIERELFTRFHNEARVRAALLQYARIKQLYLTDVFNTETWEAVAEMDNRAFQCVGETYPRTDLSKGFVVLQERTQYVKDLLLNTLERRKAYDAAYEFTTSFGLPEGDVCDIDLTLLKD